MRQPRASLHIPEPTLAKVREIAAEEQRSVAQMIRLLLDEALAAREASPVEDDDF